MASAERLRDIEVRDPVGQPESEGLSRLRSATRRLAIQSTPKGRRLCPERMAVAHQKHRNAVGIDVQIGALHDHRLQKSLVRDGPEKGGKHAPTPAGGMGGR